MSFDPRAAASLVRSEENQADQGREDREQRRDELHRRRRLDGQQGVHGEILWIDSVKRSVTITKPLGQT